MNGLDMIPPYTHLLFDPSFGDYELKTLVTYDLNMVTTWINNIETLNRCRLNRLIVGLDIEWLPNTTKNVEHPVATLQLCVGKHCLIFQILQASGIPYRLRDFLGNSDYAFVGVGIENDARKLWNDYGLAVANTTDLRLWAAAELEREELRSAGLKILAREVLRVEMEKPGDVTMSKWDERCLTSCQIRYASLDAYISFAIGRRLSAWY